MNITILEIKKEINKTIFKFFINKVEKAAKNAPNIIIYILGGIS